MNFFRRIIKLFRHITKSTEVIEIPHKVEVKDIMNVDWDNNNVFDNPLQKELIRDYSSAIVLSKELLRAIDEKVYSFPTIFIAENIVAAIVLFILRNRCTKSHNLAFLIVICCTFNEKKLIEILKSIQETEFLVDFLTDNKQTLVETRLLIINILSRIYSKKYIALFIQGSYNNQNIDSDSIEEVLSKLPDIVDSWI